MTRLSFIPLGVGDAFSALHYSSSLALESDGSWLLVDCPHPIRKMMREASGAARLDVGDILAVALTHLHADHSSGLEGLAYYSHFVLDRKVRLLAHPDVSARLWDGHLAAGMERLMPGTDEAPGARTQADYFELVPLSESSSVECGPFQIECRRTRHHIPTTALRIRTAGGSIGYSADTSFDEGLIAWLSRADLLIHETNLGVHTPHDRLAALPPELRRRMRLIHCPDGFTSADIEMLQQGRRYEVNRR